MLGGGLDSFNVLMPHTTCSLWTSYRANREELTLYDTDMLRISNDNPDQPCTTFGINNKLPVFEELYNDGIGQFHANIGHLAKPGEQAEFLKVDTLIRSMILEDGQ